MHKGRNRRDRREVVKPHGKPWGTVAVRDRWIKGRETARETGGGETGERRHEGDGGEES